MTTPPEVVPTSLIRAGVVVGPVLLLANLTAYLYHVVMSRWLGPADYGALAALLAILMVGMMPGTALQIVVARRQAIGVALPALVGPITRAAMVVGLLVAALSIPIGQFLHLDSPASVLMLAPAIALAFPVSAMMGVLQGNERFPRLAAMHLTVSSGRLAVGMALVALGAGVTGATAAAAVGLAAAIAVGAPAFRRGGEGEVRLPWGEMFAVGAGLAALMIYAGVDLFLARHFLSAVDSGRYAVGSVFTRIAQWLPAVVPLLALPRMARATDPRLLLRKAAVAVTAIDGALLVVVLVAGDRIVGLVFGEPYLLGPGLGWFVVLGAGIAYLHLIAVAGFSRGRYAFGWMVAAGVAVLAWVIGVRHGSIEQVAQAAALVTGALAVAGGLWFGVRG